ncbi:MAG TPA: prepilin peptidase [Clostridia bacterium]|jgi:prepilin peptidase CpaA|nr:prepilin peptidase [Clostridia bacterium]
MRAIGRLSSIGLLDLLLLVVLFICCYTDLQERKILNVVVLPAMLVALIMHLLLQGVAGALFWGKGTLVGLALLFIPFALGGLGAGDVKLLGVVGSFKGVFFVFKAFLGAALLGGVFAFLFLLKKKRLKKTLRNLGSALQVFLFSCFRICNLGNLENDDVEALPYGLAIVLGTIVCLAGEWLC